MATILGLKNSIFKRGVEVYKKGEFLFVVAPISIGESVFVGKDDIEGASYLEGKGLWFVPLYYSNEGVKRSHLQHYKLTDAMRVVV